jgi:serine/threonine protein kinase
MGAIGSFDYMAPDFARLIEFRGDELSCVFSLGVCIYQVLTGKLPFKQFGSGADVEYLRRWRGDKEPELSFQAPIFRILDRSAVAFFRRAMHPDRSQRFQSLMQTAEALKEIRNRTILGRDSYELDALLGHGGFGEVYRATCATGGRQVAVKRLFSDLQSRRFTREARLLQRLRNDHLVEYEDFIDVQDAGGGHHYFLVMELLAGMPGWTLRSRIRNNSGRPDLMECLELFSHYLECLQYLHGRKIIHRDIKPANLYAPEGNPAGAKVFDLGIARDMSGTATAGYVPGTLEYMPPELSREGGERGSAQSDIYSTGLSFYEALTGRPAYERLPSDERLAFQQFLKRSSGSGDNINYDHPPFIRHPRLEDIVRKAVQAKPKARYTSAAEMRREIEEVRLKIRFASESPTAGDAGLRGETSTTLQNDQNDRCCPDSPGHTIGTSAGKISRRKMTAATAAATILLSAIACGAWLLLNVTAPKQGDVNQSRPMAERPAPAEIHTGPRHAETPAKDLPSPVEVVTDIPRPFGQILHDTNALSGPAVARIPTVQPMIEHTNPTIATAYSEQAWLDLLVTTEAEIPSLTSTNKDAVLKILLQEIADLERAAGSKVDRGNQVARVTEMISKRCSDIAVEICAAANAAYTQDEIRNGDAIRLQAEDLREQLPDRLGKGTVDQLLKKSLAKREDAVHRAVAAREALRESSDSAIRTHARGTRLDLPSLPDEPPVTIACLESPSGKWNAVKPSDLPVFMTPGRHLLRFVRPDYQVMETAIVAEPDMETIAVPLPERWKAKDQLAILQTIEQYMSAEPTNTKALDDVFRSPPPIFEWPGHATRFQAMCERWRQLNQRLLTDTARSAEVAISAYVLWLYQVHDPATGTYRRFKEPMPKISFSLPPTNTALTNLTGELAAQMLRLRTWEAAGGTLQTEAGQIALAKGLTQCARIMEAGNALQATRCRFEAALLLAKPGAADSALSKLQAPDEVLRWRSHAGYRPRTSSLNTLRSLAMYVEKSGSINACDVGLALYSACFTWRNAVAGEHQYAIEVNTALGAVLRGLDHRSSEDAVAFLSAGILGNSTSSPADSPCLYLMNALTFMPGVAHGSELKLLANSWLATHDKEPEVAEKEVAIHNSLSLLRTLLQVPD